MNPIVDFLSAACLIAGGFFCVTGALGLLRLKDFFSRTHGAGVIDGLGMFLVLVGLLLQLPDAAVSIRLVLIVAFILLSGPTAVHSLARAARESGMPYGEGVEVRTGDTPAVSTQDEEGGTPSKP